MMHYETHGWICHRKFISARFPRWSAEIPRWSAEIPRWSTGILRWSTEFPRWFAEIPHGPAGIPLGYASASAKIFVDSAKKNTRGFCTVTLRVPRLGFRFRAFLAFLAGALFLLRFPAFSQKEQNGPFFTFSWRLKSFLTALCIVNGVVNILLFFGL